MTSPRRARNGPGGRSAANRGATCDRQVSVHGTVAAQHEDAVPALEAQPGVVQPSRRTCRAPSESSPTARRRRAPPIADAATSGSGIGRVASAGDHDAHERLVRVVVRDVPYCGRGRRDRAQVPRRRTAERRRARPRRPPAPGLPGRRGRRRDARPHRPGRARLTVKAGRGVARTEVEVAIPVEEAEALWPHTRAAAGEGPPPRARARRRRRGRPLRGSRSHGLWTVEVEFAVDGGGRGVPAAVVVRAGRHRHRRLEQRRPRPPRPPAEPERELGVGGGVAENCPTRVPCPQGTR